MISGAMICIDLRLICAPQITANQAFQTFKKHSKTRANQRKSLQLTPPKNHRKNDAELQPRGACGSERPEPKEKRTKKERLTARQTLTQLLAP